MVANAEEYNIVSVNKSLGYISAFTEHYSDDNYYFRELKQLKYKNIIVCAAAGNDYDNNGKLGLSYPACDPSVISVGAVSDGEYSEAPGCKLYKDSILPFSQRSDYLSILAPGGYKITADGHTKNGTSQATPMVAGLAVSAQQIANEYLGRSLTVDEFESLLQSTGKEPYDSATLRVDSSDPLEEDRVANTNKKYRRVDAYKLMKAIYAMKENEPSKPDLAPYAPTGWAGSLVLSTSSDDKTNATTFTSDTLYSHFAFQTTDKQ